MAITAINATSFWKRPGYLYHIPGLFTSPWPIPLDFLLALCISIFLWDGGLLLIGAPFSDSIFTIAIWTVVPLIMAYVFSRPLFDKRSFLRNIIVHSKFLSRPKVIVGVTHWNVDEQPYEYIKNTVWISQIDEWNEYERKRKALKRRGRK